MNRNNLRCSKAPAGRKDRGVRTTRIRFGVLKGKIEYPDDIDAPLRAKVVALFKGRRTK